MQRGRLLLVNYNNSIMREFVLYVVVMPACRTGRM